VGEAEPPVSVTFEGAMAMASLSTYVLAFDFV